MIIELMEVTASPTFNLSPLSSSSSDVMEDSGDYISSTEIPSFLIPSISDSMANSVYNGYVLTTLNSSGISTAVLPTISDHRPTVTSFTNLFSSSENLHADFENSERPSTSSQQLFDFVTTDEHSPGITNSATEASLFDLFRITEWFKDMGTLAQAQEPFSLAQIFNESFNATCSYILENNITTYDNYSNCTEPDLEKVTTKNYWALLLLVFPLFTVFGNVLVILSVKRERSLQNVTNYFIVSLAVADLLVAAAVMPFGVYILLNELEWGLSPIFCDVYIAMDVTCSTSSICNLVAISIDRFIAVTRPIKYAKHKSNTRVWLTILFVWVFSGLVGSPIVLGLNTPEADTEPYVCSFHNKYFVLFSSLCSFYIPCAILVFLYYRIFKVIRERAKKAVATRRANTKGSTVIENIAQTKKLAETALGVDPSNVPTPSKSPNLEERTGSGSQDEGEDNEKDDGDLEVEGELEEEGSADSEECHIISNNQVATAFVLASVRVDERVGVSRSEANGNHDSGYAPSNLEESPLPVPEISQISPKHSLLHPDQCKRNGLNQQSLKKPEEGSVTIGEEASSSGSSKKVPVPAAVNRFTICKVHKASRKKREKSSAKRERKATKTLAIVLGLFLACWLPFFTCNIMDALCSLMSKDPSCNPGPIPFLLTTWLGYINSSFNPAIYTVFNPEFRKAFKKLLGFKP